MSNLLTFPALHICSRCEEELATDGKPCQKCQWEREQFVRAAKRLNILPVEEKKIPLKDVLRMAVTLIGLWLLIGGIWMMAR